MRSTTNPVVAMVLAVFLMLVGLYLRGQPGNTAAWLGTMFVIVGGLGFVANLYIWLSIRRG